MSFFTAYFSSNSTEAYIGLGLFGVLVALVAKDYIIENIAKHKNKAKRP